jgi:putative membrane protein
MTFGYDGFAAIGLVGLVWFAISIAFTIAIIVLIVLAIRWLIRNTGSGAHPGEVGGPGAPREDTALATLRERFARGEIDAEEFEQRRRTLGG